MPIAGYTTTVPVTTSIGHITKMLAREGALSITQDIGRNGVVTGMSFAIDTEFGRIEYRLPVRAEGVQATLKRDGVAPRYQLPEHAARVAWRIAHDWLRAQLALIDAGMVTLPEVMLPYTLVSAEETMFDKFIRQRSIER